MRISISSHYIHFFFSFGGLFQNSCNHYGFKILGIKDLSEYALKTTQQTILLVATKRMFSDGKYPVESSSCFGVPPPSFSISLPSNVPCHLPWVFSFTLSKE